VATSVPPAPTARRQTRRLAPDATTAPARAARTADFGTEERDKDFVTFKQGYWRRLWSTVFLGVTLVVAAQLGLANVPFVVQLAIFIGAVISNLALTALATSPKTYAWWWRYVFAGFDALLISSLTAAFGGTSFALLYFLAIVPYSFDRGKAIGQFTAIASAVGFIGASAAHHLLFPEKPFSWLMVLLVAVLLLIVSFQVIPIPTRLIRRVRHTREAISEAEAGNLQVRASARTADELGFMERSFNHMLEEIGQIIGAVQREADEVAAYADRVAEATQALNRSGTDFSTTASALSTQLQEQRRHTESGAKETRSALGASERLRERAGEMETNARTLVQAAGSSRDAIGRASNTLVTIGDRVRDTSVTVGTLAEASERIGDFVEAVSRIARQTNLLALNAAIEAARAGEQGKGFAVVAEEVRKLAEESGRAAKEIAITVTAIRESVDDVVQSMSTGAQEVRDVGQIAAEANGALGAMLSGIERISEVITEAASVSRAQSVSMQALAGSIGAVERVSVEAAARAESAADAAARQTSSLEGLSDTSQRLADLADRLRESISRFSVAALPNTREIKMPTGTYPAFKPNVKLT
jgi:methyl-accepting chemotaxis protein